MEIRSKEGRPRGTAKERDRAADWLLDLLKDGPVPKARVMKSARAHNSSLRTIQRAFVQARIDSFPIKGVWYWALPGAVFAAPADVVVAPETEPTGPAMTDPAELTKMMISAARSAQKAGKSAGEMEQVLRKWNAGRDT